MHIITITFDDGFARSFKQIAEIYESHGLQASLNVIASASQPEFIPPNSFHAGFPVGDFNLWNALQARGHEINPHGYRHANKAELPLPEAQDLILRCFDVFSVNLAGFHPSKAVFAFPYNSSTPELEKWLSSHVRAFRTGGGGINPLPHAGQVRLTCTAFGPGNCERHLESQIAALLGQPQGWLVYNGHGLDDEGWGPMRAQFLNDLLGKLKALSGVRVLSIRQALDSMI